MRSILRISLLGCAGAAVAAAPQDDAPFTLVAEWSPMASSQVGFHLVEENGLASILDPGPARRRVTYASTDVAGLLPPEDLEVGGVWQPDAAPIVALLRQLHPSASTRLHHHHAPVFREVTDENGTRMVPVGEGRPLPDAPLGVRATLLSRDPAIDVLLRAHVEFQLRDGTVFYTPAQFEGRLICDPLTGAVRAFHLEVPDRNTNVDINVLMPDEEFPEVDIGYVPRLGLWTEENPPALDELALEEARLRLRRAFYDFATIDWQPLEDLYWLAELDGRPMHVIVLFGTLDDESC